ncbi:MAG: nucleolar RNA-binding Nop10p family protein [Candidatus Woesearchaeota archaeon]
MGKEILKCLKCSCYTLEEEHCGMKTQSIKPAKYSVDDKWGHWRRVYKKKNDMEN